MVGQPGFFDLSTRYEQLSAAGDPLERLATVALEREVHQGQGQGRRRSQVVQAGRPCHLDVRLQNHIGINRAHGLIRTWDASAANAHDGARLPDLVSRNNTASGVWADTAYRSKKNEAFLARGMFTSNIHQRKPHRKAMPERTSRANAKRSKVRSAVEHVFAGQKHRMGLVVRTIGIARARIKIGMANLAYNSQRLAWLEGRTAPA